MSEEFETPDVRPFRALRFTERAGPPGDLLAPPYDVISKAARAELLSRSPHNVVRIELPEERAEDGPAENRYTRARATLRGWVRDGLLAPDETESLYLYDQEFEVAGTKSVRRSFFARVRLAPEGTGAIRPHERTLSGPRADRMEMLRHLRAQTSPVFSMYRARRPLPAPVGTPVLDAITGGERHRLYRVRDRAAIDAVLASLDGPLYIADGHHRYATSLTYRAEAQAAATAWSGGEPENYVLMALVPAAGLLVLPTHRLVSSDRVPADLDARLARHFTLQSVPGDVAELVHRLGAAGVRATAFGLMGPGASDRRLAVLRDPSALEARMPEGRSSAWKRLDTARLEHGLLGALGIDEGAVAAGAVRYTHDANEAARELAEGRAGLAVLLNPTPVEQVLDVADARDLMPQKSTFFYPKLPTGLVLYDLDGLG